MKLAELERRLAALEKSVALLEERLTKALPEKGPWWVTEAGRFANDPVFDEIVRLGREYRESLHPDRQKEQKHKHKTKKKHPLNART